MGNMSYCRFENTASDLADCAEHMDEMEELNKYETRGRDRIIEMSVSIALAYGNEIGRPVEEVEYECDAP